MTSFADLMTLTTEITRRPELSSMTTQAVRAAVVRAHCSAFFPRDMVVGVATPTRNPDTPLVQVDDVFAVVPNLRAVKFVQCVDPSTSRALERLTNYSADDIYTHEGLLRPSAYTVVGPQLRTYPIAYAGKLEIYAYALPTTTSGGFASWIADLYPDEIATWAAAVVLHRTGNNEQAQQLLKTAVSPFKDMLIEAHESLQIG